MKKIRKMVAVNLEFSKEALKFIDEIAKASGVSRNNTIRVILGLIVVQDKAKKKCSGAT